MKPLIYSQITVAILITTIMVTTGACTIHDSPWPDNRPSTGSEDNDNQGPKKSNTGGGKPPSNSNDNKQPKEPRNSSWNCGYNFEESKGGKRADVLYPVQGDWRDTSGFQSVDNPSGNMKYSKYGFRIEPYGNIGSIVHYYHTPTDTSFVTTKALELESYLSVRVSRPYKELNNGFAVEYKRDDWCVTYVIQPNPYIEGQLYLSRKVSTLGGGPRPQNEFIETFKAGYILLEKF